MKKFEGELRNLQVALEQAQTILTSPEVGRLSLKEQLSHRQVGKENSGWAGETAQVSKRLLYDHGTGSRELTLKARVWPILRLREQ